MELSECQAIIDALEDSRKETWNQARFIAHSVYQIMSKRPLSQQDICRFSWENETEEKPEVDHEEWQNAFAEVEEIRKKLNIK